MIFTCPRCARSYSVPDAFAGLICACTSTAPPSWPAGLQSPASTQPERAVPTSSSVARDGGRGASDSASGSPGREPEKGSQRSPQGQGGAIPALAVDESAKTATVSPDDLKAADAWMKTKMFKKGGIQDGDFRAIIGAVKAFGLKPDEKWRDWVKERWEAGGAAQASVVRMLAAAGQIKLTPVTGGTTPPLKELEKKVFDWLKANAGKEGKTLADLVASVDPKVTQALVDRLVDGGFLYTPLNGTYGTAI